MDREKLDKILRLASSSNENESAAAARKLCSILLREKYSFVYTRNDSDSENYLELYNRKYRECQRLSQANLDLNEKIKNLEAEAHWLNDQIKHLNFRLSNSEPKEKHDAEYAEDKKRKWRSIVSRFNSYCRHCRNDIFPGDLIYWKKGEGSIHKECFDSFVKTNPHF